MKARCEPLGEPVAQRAAGVGLGLFLELGAANDLLEMGGDLGRIGDRRRGLSCIREGGKSGDEEDRDEKPQADFHFAAPICPAMNSRSKPSRRIRTS